MTLIGFVTFGQVNKLDQINIEVDLIESDTTLIKTKFDLNKITGTSTDGGGILKVWTKENRICKIEEEIGLSYGRIKTTIYLQNGAPIKIKETEENFGYKNDELNYNILNEVFGATIYVFDWYNDKNEIEKTGIRVFSEGNCAIFDYEPILERAKKAIK